MARFIPILMQRGSDLQPFYDLIVTIAVMGHPEDERERQRFAGALIFELRLHESGDLAITNEVLTELAQTPPAEEMFETAFGGWGKKYAQQILRFLLGGAGSLGKAQFLLAEVAKAEHEKRRSQGRPHAPPTSDKSIRAAWRAFRAASHMWAAYYDMWAKAGKEPVLHTEDALMTLLGRAEAYRRAGIAGGWLDSDTTWAVPPELQLHIPQVELDIQPLSEEERRILRGYQPRER
jgi:hypothetical protein